METIKVLRYSSVGLRSLFYVLVFSLFMVWCLAMYFGTSGPTNPIPAEGRIHPHNFHGTTVYLSKIESLVVGFDTWTLLLITTVVIGFAAKWIETLEVRKRRSS